MSNIDPIDNSFEIPSTSLENIPPTNLSTAFVSLINLSQITFYDPKEDLKSYLSHDFEGLVILSSFENNPKKVLLDDMRTLLVKKVMEREVNVALREANFEVGAQKLEKFVVDRFRFIQLANEIEKLFNEEAGLYYTPFAQEGGVRTNPGGKLWERHNLVKRILRDAGILKFKSNHNNTKNKSNSNTSEVTVDENTTEKLEWLKKNVEPFDKVQDYWNDTFKVRQDLAKEQKNNEKSVFSMFDCLKQQDGVTLIHLDFKRILTKVSDEIVNQNWTLLRKFVREYSKIDEQLESNTSARKLKTLLPKDSSDEDNEVIILLLLAHMLHNSTVKPVSSKQTGRKRKNLSGDTPPKNNSDQNEQLEEADLVTDFVSIAKIDTQIDEVIAEKKNIALKAKTTVQPYMLFVGPPEKCTSFYVVVDDHKYKANDPLEALKLNFEIFYFGNYEFPKTCRNIWIFIQKFLYDISTVGNKYPAKIKKMFGYIKHNIGKTL